MPRQSRKREGRRDTGPIRGVPAGAISRRAPRSRVVAKAAARWVPKRCKAPRSFGNRRSSRGGGGRGPRPCPRREGESPAPPKQRRGDPGARGNVRGGELARKTGEPFARAPSAHAGCGSESFRSSRGSLHRAVKRARKRTRGPPRKRRKLGGNVGSAPPRERKRKMRHRPPAIHGRGSTARRVCPCVVSCCRSRQASPGPEKRERGPLLTERPIHVDGA